jgi:hypothetical protein
MTSLIDAQYVITYVINTNGDEHHAARVEELREGRRRGRGMTFDMEGAQLQTNVGRLLTRDATRHKQIMIANDD